MLSEENTVLHEAYALKCVVYNRLKQPPRPAPPDAKCYGCGQLGHYATDCPNVEGSRTDRGFFCWLVGGDYLALLKGLRRQAAHSRQHGGRAPEVYDPARLEQLFGKLARHVPSEDDDAFDF